MRRHLGVPMRLAIVLSLAWLVVGWFGLGEWLLHDDSKVYRITVAQCAKDYPSEISIFPSGEYTQCEEDAAKSRDLGDQGAWGTAFGLAIALLVFGWIVGGIVMIARRWVLAGRTLHAGDA